MTLFGAAGYAKGRVANKEPTREAGAVISGAGYDAIIRDCKVYALPLIKLGQQPEAWTFISLQDIEWTERLIIAICRLLSPYCTGWVWPYNNRRLLCLGGGQWEAAVFKDELDRLVKPETRFAVKTYASTKMGDQPMRIVKSLLTPNQPYK